MRVSVKQTVSWLLALALVLPGAMILSSPLEAGAAETSTNADSLPAEPVKVPAGKTAADFIKNPAQPDIYTLRNDYEVTRAGKKEINYQPYVATVGAAATQEQKDKVNKTITLPDFAGYDKPKDGGNTIEKYNISYQGIVNAATGAGATTRGDTKYGFAHNALREFLYKGGLGSIRVRHVFQDLTDFSKYGPKPGESEYRYTMQTGNLGDLPLIEALPAEQRKGFVPENTGMKVVIAKDSITVEQRYNLAHFDVTYNTDDGTAVPARTLYYGQVIPPLADSDIPTKIGATFLGWKPSVDLKGTVNGTKNTFSAGQIMKDSSGNAIKNLNAELIMPAQNVKFTAAWEENDKAKYTVLYWAEKPDHAGSAKLRDKYDFIGTRVVDNVATGSRPDLSAETIKNVEFPDLDKTRLRKAWTNKSYFNKFFVYNDDLTKEENAESGNPAVVKSVSSTGKTVYNVYYDRQVYTLYFTKSLTSYEAFFPKIVKNGKTVGTPDNPYTFKARFNQRMVDQWPNDPLEVKGFEPGFNSFGWTLNIPDIQDYVNKDTDDLNEFRDTPPYRLSADLFVDIPGVPEDAKYTIPIDGQPDQTGGPFDIALGIEPGEQAMPHHLDFLLEDFDGNFIPDYDLYRVKSDTDAEDYEPITPPILGYTAVSEKIPSVHFKENELDDYNNSRQAVKPFDNDKGKMRFYKNFSDGDGFSFDKNGYIKFQYKRNTYELKFNTNPDILKDDSAYDLKEKTKIYYDYKLRDLGLDSPKNLSKLGLTDLLEHDASGNLVKDQRSNYKIKKPDGIPAHYEFKGWALDPKGTQMVRDGNETMPNHNMVLYAKWDEPDKKWKVIFDPDGGNLPQLDEKTLTKTQSTIREGDAEQQVEVTYPQKLANDGDKQQFTVLQRQQLVKPPTPTRDGYNFLGWEVRRYKKDANGNYTDEVDTSYRDKYGVPELYAFGNDVVDPIYLKAIWVPNYLEKVTIYHHYLDMEYHIDKTVSPNPKSRIIENQRAGQFVRTSADQSAEWRLATDEELQNSTDPEVKNLYKEYNDRLGPKRSLYSL